jgi:hypothetical protein
MTFRLYEMYGETELMRYENGMLNYHFQQPNFLNTLEFHRDGWTIICHCKNVDIFYKHSAVMDERIVEILTRGIQFP